MALNKKNIFKIIIILFILTWTLLPIVWIVMNSFKGGADITAYPPRIVFSPTVDNYIQAFQGRQFRVRFFNSLIIASFNTLICLIAGTLGAYGFSRFKIKGKKHILFWIISTRMFPPVVASIPFFIIFNRLGILNTRVSLIIAYISFNLPLVVWLMKGFIDDVPIAIEEAAQIDGASAFQVFFKVTLPLVKPGLAASAILSFIFSWNEFLFALILTSGRQTTLPVNITEYIRWGEGIFWGEISAVAVIILLPILLLSIFVQKPLVEGMSFRGIK